MAGSARYRVFLSYAHEDQDKVRRIYSGLKQRRLDVWFDKENLGPGRWKPAIIKAITQSRYFIICISEAALKKTGDEPGFQDNEINTAYNIAQEQPDKEFTIVPVRLESCDRGDFRLTGFQQYDLFENFEAGLDKLAVDLGGISLADAAAQDERSKIEKIIDRLLGKADAAYYANDFEKAITVLDTVLEMVPDNASAYSNKGTALVKLGQNEEAIKAYDKAIEIKSDYSGVWYNKGVTLAKLGRNEEALEIYNKVLEFEQNNPKIWGNKCSTLGRLGRYK
jgi:tetratricopeptide (TPR) repeat protein